MNSLARLFFRGSMSPTPSEAESIANRAAQTGPATPTRNAAARGYGLSQVTVAGWYNSTTFTANTLNPEPRRLAQRPTTSTRAAPTSETYFQPCHRRSGALPAQLSKSIHESTTGDAWIHHLREVRSIRYADTNDATARAAAQNDLADWMRDICPPTTTDNEKMVLALSLEAACNAVRNNAVTKNDRKRVPVRDVIDALNHLNQTDIRECIQTARRKGHDEETSAAENLAWRIAQKLAATQTGFGLLKKISAPTRELGGNSGIRQDANVRTFLNAADQLLTEHGRQVDIKADPNALMDYCFRQIETPDLPANTLLITGLPAMQRACKVEATATPETAAVSDTAASCAWNQWAGATQEALDLATDNWAGYLGNPGSLTDQRAETFLHQRRTLQRNRQRQLDLEKQFASSAHALRNGFYSNAPGSKWQAVRKRQNKVAVWAERGKRSHEQFRLTRHKSPFKGTLSLPVTTPILHWEAMRKTLGIMETELCEHGGLKGHQDDTGEIDVYPDYDFATDRTNGLAHLQSAVKYQFIRDWRASFMGDVLNLPAHDERQLAKLVEEVLTRFGDNSENFKKAVHTVATAFNEALTPERLQSWAQTLNFSEASVENSPDAARRARYGEFAEAMRYLVPDQDLSLPRLTRHAAVSGSAPDGNPTPPPSSPANFDEIFKQVSDMRLGSTLSLSNGNTWGLSLSGIVNNGAALASVAGVPVAPRVIGSATVGRTAVVNAGITTPGGVLVVGIQDDKGVRAGGGATAGWLPFADANASVGAGMTADLTLGADYTNLKEAVIYRFNRLGPGDTGIDGKAPGLGGDAALAARMAALLKKLMEGPSKPADDPEYRSLEEEIAIDFPDVSIGFLEHADTTTRDLSARGRFTGSVGASLGSGAYALGASISTAFTGTWRRARNRENFGVTTNPQKIDGHQLSGTVSAAGTLALDSTEGQAAASFAEASVYPPQAEIGALTLEVYKGGELTAFQTVVHNDEVKPTSYLLKSYRNADDLAKYIAPNINAWSNRLARRKHPALYGADNGDDNERTWAVQHEEATLKRYLDNALENANQNTNYVAFLEIAPELVPQINGLLDLKKAAELSGNHQHATQYEKAANALLHDEDSYLPAFLVDIETWRVARGLKFSLGLSWREAMGIAKTTSGFI
ncbi:hypothetical protein [Actimicrobium sp. GrIS 1.19]|uniref:hypothetical protein n=1 Tax=Actimicrobium sp. GrIS 1.19 TaxID=3071708 RepID=UPI002E16645E